MSSQPTFRRGISPGLVAIIGLVIAIVVVALAAVVLTGGSSPGSSSQVVSGPAGPIGVGALAPGVLTADDLGAGWTAYPNPHPIPATIFTQGPCSSPLWAKELGAYQSSFVNGNYVSTAHGAVISQVLEAPSGAIAGQQRQLVLSPAYVPCLERLAAQEAQSQFPATAHQAVGGVSAAPLPVSLPPTAAAVTTSGHTVTIAVTSSGAPETIYDDSVEMFLGVYEGRLDVSWCSCAPLTGQTAQQAETRLAERLSDLPPGGTGAG
jgi:hypothetical protein